MRVGLAGYLEVDVTAVTVFLRRGVRVERINVFEMRRAGIQARAVDDKVPVIVDLNGFAAKGDESLNIKLVLVQPADAFRFKNDDLTPFRAAKIVAHSIDKQVIATDDLEFYDVFTLVKNLPDRVAAIIR